MNRYSPIVQVYIPTLVLPLQVPAFHKVGMFLPSMKALVDFGSYIKLTVSFRHPLRSAYVKTYLFLLY